MKIKLVLTDQELVRKIEAAARKAKQPADQWAADNMVKAVRQALGLERDLTVTETAQRMGWHRNTVFNYIRSGALACYHPRNRATLIPLAAVEALKARTA